MRAYSAELDALPSQRFKAGCDVRAGVPFGEKTWEKMEVREEELQVEKRRSREIALIERVLNYKRTLACKYKTTTPLHKAAQTLNIALALAEDGCIAESGNRGPSPYIPCCGINCMWGWSGWLLPYPEMKDQWIGVLQLIRIVRSSYCVPQPFSAFSFPSVHIPSSIMSQLQQTASALAPISLTERDVDKVRRHQIT
nr:hypothetical protein Iba_chr11bCG9710 [Ipomoea batatas]